MKNSTKILVAYLALSGLMPFAVASMAAFAPARAAEVLQFGPLSPYVQKLLLFISVCLYAFAAVYAFAIVQLIKKRKAGFSVALLLSGITIGTGLYLMTGYKLIGVDDIMTGASDFGKGILMLVLTLVARRKENFA